MDAQFTYLFRDEISVFMHLLAACSPDSADFTMQPRSSQSTWENLDPPTVVLVLRRQTSSVINI
jgi:hypothetical protein